MNAKKAKPPKKTADKDQTAEAPEAAAEVPVVPGEIPELPESLSGEQDPAPSGDRPGDRQEELEAEIADLKDKVLRAMAELENFRRRAERERSDVSKYAITNFARDMVSVADNLRRALDSAANEGAGDNGEGLAAGIELTERELIAALERHGITKINAMGKLFDHDLHQAMFEVEDKDKPAGTIIEELQAGYMLKDRLLRPAMVGLAKGGPEAKADAAAGDGEDSADGPGDGPQHIDTSA